MMNKRLLAVLVPLALAAGCKSDNRAPVPVVVQPTPPIASTPAPAPAPAPAPLPTAPAPTPSADVLWQWDATAVAPFGIHARQPHSERVSLVNVGGRPGVRLLTKAGDNNVNGSNASERCDLRLSNALSYATEGQRWRFKHGIWLGNDYTDLPMSPVNAQPWNWAALFDWHDDSDTPGSQGPLQLILYPPTATSTDRPTGMLMQVFGGAWKQGEKPNGEFKVGQLVRNTWLDFDLEIGWSWTAGFCKGLLNGKQFMDYKGPTLLNGNGAYLKLANYHTAHGKDSAVVHGAITLEALR